MSIIQHGTSSVCFEVIDVDWTLCLRKHNGTNFWTEVSVQPKRFWNAKRHCVQANWYCYCMLNSFFINRSAFYCAYFNPLLIQCLANANFSSCWISTILDVSHQRVFSLCYIKLSELEGVLYSFSFPQKAFFCSFLFVVVVVHSLQINFLKGSHISISKCKILTGAYFTISFSTCYFRSTACQTWKAHRLIG